MAHWGPFETLALAKLHIHFFISPNFRTIHPVVTENLSRQNLGIFLHACGGPLESDSMDFETFLQNLYPYSQEE